MLTLEQTIPESNMKWLKVSGIAGSLLLFTGIFLPIGILNQETISLVPVWHNYTLSGGLWSWRDISFFAVTAFILIGLSIFFTIKNKQAGLLTTGFLLLFISLLIFAFMLEVKSRLYGIDGVSFSLGWGWLVIIPSVALILSGGFVKEGKQLKR